MQPQGNRSEFIDGVRGFALFGILCANLLWFKAPYWARPDNSFLLHPHEVHRAVEFLLALFVQGKFYILLAFLFGLGVGWQIMRCEGTGRSPRGFILRRMAVLFAFGALHAFLLWIGDILMALAVTGGAGLVFVRRKTRTLMVSGAVFYLAGLAIWAGAFVAYDYLHQIEDWFEYYDLAVLDYYEALGVYQTGTWLEIAKYRSVKIATLLPKFFIFTFPFLMAFFLWGVALARRAGAADLREVLAAGIGVRGFVLLLGAGILFNLASALIWIYGIGVPGGGLFANFVVVLIYESGNPLLMFAYLAGLALWWRNGADSFLWGGLVAVGRTALSNYLLQTIVATTLFYGYGFGLYGRVGMAWIPPLAIAIFSFQMILSRCWLRRFQFGPAEYLWRRLTYPNFRVAQTETKE